MRVITPIARKQPLQPHIRMYNTKASSPTQRPIISTTLAATIEATPIQTLMAFRPLIAVAPVRRDLSAVTPTSHTMYCVTLIITPSTLPCIQT